MRPEYKVAPLDAGHRDAVLMFVAGARGVHMVRHVAEVAAMLRVIDAAQRRPETVADDLARIRALREAADQIAAVLRSGVRSPGLAVARASASMLAGDQVGDDTLDNAARIVAGALRNAEDNLSRDVRKGRPASPLTRWAVTHVQVFAGPLGLDPDTVAAIAEVALAAAGIEVTGRSRATLRRYATR